MFGVVSILLNYSVDRQKENFRLSGGKCHVWGRPAKFVVSEENNETIYIQYSGIPFEPLGTLL